MRVADYIDHMLNAIERILRYTQGMSDSAFLSNELVQDAVIRNLEVVGEAARNIERDHPAFATAHPDVPWEEMYLMRNRVAHGYFSVDLGIVWQTLQLELPKLHQLLLRLKHGELQGAAVHATSVHHFRRLSSSSQRSIATSSSSSIAA